MCDQDAGRDPNAGGWLRRRDDGEPIILPDRLGAARLLLAGLADLDEATEQFDQILRERPTMPLVSGLIHLGLAFARGLYGEQRWEMLNAYALALSLDEGVADPEGSPSPVRE
jgi:hypothetical protein